MFDGQTKLGKKYILSVSGSVNHYDKRLSLEGPSSKLFQSEEVKVIRTQIGL